MLRKATAAAVVTAVALLTMVVSAAQGWADTVAPYPAPPVTGSTIALTTSSAVPLTTSSAVVPPAPVPVQPAVDLASTGAGLNVGLTVGIGLAIILLGITLVVLGARRSGRKHA
ncbi:hypothetical protein [Nakamurella lactea]|uniref:hypothetical protein n=1 Tax=Nakamurella lactea TaxID=459515 RepID=UPI0003FEA3F3|nr:hypothetical protein [Nakamurella lactea]